jgi:DNA mismatch repair protein MutS2
LPQTVVLQVFPSTSLLTNEFEQITLLLKEHCISPMGKQVVAGMEIMNDAVAIRGALEMTREMIEIISQGLPFPAHSYLDITDDLKLLRIENSLLTEGQFHDLLQVMFTVKAVYHFFHTRRNVFPALHSLCEPHRFEQSIIDEIELIIDETGHVRSQASAELSRIRKSLQRNRAEADRIYIQVINKYRKQGWLAATEESSRNGRRVIAIFAEQKRAVKGIVHDESATGKTAFVEPEETIPVNQSIVSLEYEERLEIRRILAELSSKLRKYVPVMTFYISLLGKLDFKRAKSLFARDILGSIPKIEKQSGMDLKAARHPLLYLHHRKAGRKTIPFDLKLDKEQRILVISGPNAGGKTVCMKTSGLLQMMIQSGIPVSCNEDSVFGVFDNLLVDIGDSQSIEYELSTYSSRLRHMRIFLERANEKSLFLIDEFGTGTDPNLGGALAEAILEELNQRGSTGIITTHYLNLKVFADKTPGVINGSMEFDLRQLKPLYSLVIGKPGSSYTFLVAERSGLPPEIIKKARRMVTRKNLMLEKLLTQVQQEKQSLKSRMNEVMENDKTLKEQISNYHRFIEAAQARISELESRVIRSDEKMKRESETRFRNFIKDWKKSKDKKEVYDRYYRLFVPRKQKESSESIAKKRKEKQDQIRKLLRPGMLVKLENSKTIGTVEKIDHDKAHVIFGNVKAVCDIVNLEVIGEKE